MILKVPGHREGFVIALHTHLAQLVRYITETGILRLRLDSGLLVNIEREAVYPWFDAYVRFFFLREGRLPTIPEPADGTDLVTKELTFVSCLLWVLCHEYGHYLAGHLNGGSLHTLRIGECEVETCEGGPRTCAAWEREYYADLIGLDLLAQAVQHDAFRLNRPGDLSHNERMRFASWGVDVAVGLLGLVDRRYFLYGGKHYLPGSHPPAHMRLQNLLTKRPSFFRQPPMFTSIITDYFDAVYKGLQGVVELRAP